MGKEQVLTPVEAARNRPITTREWDLYPGLFRLEHGTAFWGGKHILDVGSGFKTTDPHLTFPGATVAMVDPERGKRITEHTADEKHTGVVQELPFEADAFDLILSSHSVPQQLRPTDMPRALSELLRTIRGDGEIRLMPCARIFHVTTEIEKALRSSGFIFDILTGGTDGPIGTFFFPGPMQEKGEAWQRFHRTLFPRETMGADGRFHNGKKRFFPFLRPG